jgi:hypothetical protein
VIAATRRLLPPAFAAALLLILALSAFRARADEPAGPAAGVPDEVALSTAPDPSGAALLTEAEGGYLSPVTAAPRPFTHMLLRWEAAIPLSATLELEVRASLDGTSWSEWGHVEENADLWTPEDGPDLRWSSEIYAGEGASFWQVRATPAPGPDGATPALRRITVATVDARFGPAEPGPDVLPELVGPDGAALLARPAVVSRTAWGSPDGQGSRATPAYRAVRHMVVHHTADSNSLAAGQRWADRVRAIWSFHTNTRGWGDIGYNFLIDPNGVIYEGRAGGDDAVAFHDTANYGSLGVAMIGTYAAGPPPAAAVDSLVNLLAWKADQKDIDPLGSAFYYGCSISQYCSPFASGAIVPNLSGHRTVTPGHTTCPGDALFALIPQIRQRVRERLAGAPPPPDPVKVELLNIAFDRTSVPAGELLKVTFTVRNSGSVAVEGQAPEARLDPASGAYNLADSYVYDEGECFLGDEGQSYEAFPKENGRLRVTLGPAEDGRQPPCAGGTGGYPWRWGINGRLEPGQTRDVVGYLRLRSPGTLTLRAGLINEYVGYLAENAAGQTITVTPERQMPAPAAYDDLLRPVAHVYRVGELPANFLARAAAPADLPRGAYLGSFPWLGEARRWGEGGPLEAGPAPGGAYLVEQTRVFVAPAPGVYTFRLAPGAAGWLWVDGRQVTGGRAQGSDFVGSVELAAGRHVLSLRALGAPDKALGYSVQVPGASTFSMLADGLSGGDEAPAERFGAVFRQFTGMSLAADDLGGVGVAKVLVSVNGGPWAETTGPLARLGALSDGAYSVRYTAFDAAGNQSEERTLSFRVDSALEVQRVYLPLTAR